MKFISLILFVLGLVFQPSRSLAAGFHYCSGKVLKIVTRSTNEKTHIMVEGVNGWVWLNYGGVDQAEMHERQFAMLLAAYMSGSDVLLEFEDNSLSCADDHNGMRVRYVMLQ